MLDKRGAFWYSIEALQRQQVSYGVNPAEDGIIILIAYSLFVFGRRGFLYEREH